MPPDAHLFISDWCLTTLDNMSHPRRRVLSTALILWGTVLATVALLWLGFGHVSEVSVGPGSLVNLADVVRVDHRRPRHLELFDAQLSVTALTPLQLLIKHLNSNVTLINPIHNEAQQPASLASTNLQSILAASVAAYRYLGIPIQATHGLLVRDILPTSPVRNKVHLGDLITAVNGYPVSSLANFEAALTARPHSPTVTLLLQRQQLHTSRPTSYVVKAPFDEGKLGIVITTATLYRLPTALQLHIPKTLEGTEGLAQAIAIIDSYGKIKVAHPLALGLIGLVTPDGRLAPVFGIYQRVIAMRDSHLRYVLVPSVQRNRAQQASHGTITVIGVTYLSQAVQEIERLARVRTPKESVR